MPSCHLSCHWHHLVPSESRWFGDSLRGEVSHRGNYMVSSWKASFWMRCHDSLRGAKGRRPPPTSHGLWFQVSFLLQRADPINNTVKLTTKQMAMILIQSQIKKKGGKGMFSTNVQGRKGAGVKRDERKRGVRKEGRRKEGEEESRKGSKSRSDLRLSASSLRRWV